MRKSNFTSRGWRSTKTTQIYCLACLLSFALGSATIARADIVIDQEHILSSSSALIEVSITQTLAQTFTVGIMGTLAQVDLQISRELNVRHPLIVELRRTLSTGFPDDSPDALFGQVSVEADRFFVTSGFTQFFVAIELGSESFDVAVGDLLAIVLSSDTDGSGFLKTRYLWPGASSGYDDGLAYGKGFFSGGVWREGVFSNAQHGFRTYVLPIPEPSSVMLAALALLSLLAHGHRRRAS